MTFGGKLKKARIEKHMTQKQLAKMLSVKHNSISNWENDINKPDPDTIELLCGVLDVTPNYLLASSPDDFSPFEKLLIKRYRSLDDFGRETIDIALDRETERVTSLKNRDKRIEELESTQATIIDIRPRLENNTRLIEYHHNASAGTGVFILGNETVDQLPIPDTPENRKVDYAIKVSGNSMEPDYNDGDIVLVSQKAELNHGDVGIFIINNNAYIKEYSDTELISRNPDVDNIMISEYDNIVCVGKVVGKYEE